ncbi:uncharacterized protein LOC123879425 isoform X1 [Maniola jurtina]|uniref:uncharacterized protein LOC123879425 isoform X1 n=1 Tax=Maniola jurtina TaxID=191418 RepID=UPI001E6874CF|nr:uncharacterized protein LOC123879425 isoform X1 [Maniola jurtina]
MESTRRNKSHLRDLLMLISKMSLQDCCVHVPSEFGLHWNEVSRAVRNSRLPMTPTSVASVLYKYAAKTFSEDEIAHIASRLRLKSIAIRPRTWHVINLTDQITDEPVNMLMQSLPSRVKQALKSSANGNKKPQVQTMKLGDFIFISVQMVTELKEGSVVYVVSAPGMPVALVSTLHSNLLTACVQGLCYRNYTDACLSGKDIRSLLHIACSDTNAAGVTEMPEYSGTPCLIRGGIDFTNAAPLKQYVSQKIGPDPPILEFLKVTAEMDFYDREILDKKIKVTLQIKGANSLDTLARWGAIGAISPASQLFDVYSNKSNQIKFTSEDVDE